MRTLSVGALLLALGLAPAVAAADAVASHVTRAEAQAKLRTANDACLKEEWAGCIEGYDELLKAGYGGADLFYNLGTAHLRQGRLGPAVLNLERALRADPSDEDARANLERAQRMRVDKVVGAAEEAGGEESLVSRIVAVTRGGQFALAFLGLWVGGGLLLLLARWSRLQERRGLLLTFGTLAVLAAVPAGAVTLAHAWRESGAREAVVLAANLPVREAPKDALKPGFEIHEGLKVRLVDQEGGWKRIRLSNGLEGWIASDGIEEIDSGG